MTKTQIEWADRVWNPVVGCTPVSTGCFHCYAKRIYERFSGGAPFSKIVLHPDRLLQPFHWKQPTRVFVNSMSDLFHPDVPFDYIDDVFAVMSGCSDHTFMILTKRPARMLEFTKQYYLPGAKVTNIWMGVTAENQKTADERIPLLLETPAAVRFVSVEPMLGPVNLSGNKSGVVWPWAEARNEGHGIDWVICGCESGPKARPMNIEWARSLRDQCQDAGVPFFLKQMFVGGKRVHMPELDGRVWAQFPEVKK